MSGNITRESILNVALITLAEKLNEESFCIKGEEEYERCPNTSNCKECIVRWSEKEARKFLFDVK